MTGEVVRLENILLRRGPLTLLDGVDWLVAPGEHWALLGPNGAGKTLILRIVTGYVWPTDGRVTVLGRRLGEYDLRLLRRSIGWVSQALADLMPGGTPVREVVVSGCLASLGLYTEPEPEMVEKAEALAVDFGLKDLLDRPFARLSSGERQRALLARAALPEPALLILDEPMSNLDMGGRELFLGLLSRLARAPRAPSLILTTHNINEIAPFMTSALVVKKGRVVGAGPLERTLTPECLGRAFDLDLRVERTASGRWVAGLAGDGHDGGRG
ncbi:MAG: ATP-binding cassette domain-containing protein [Deltaproteobacteria bacterium]|jgi:iron complex transport system ATP-binding protein|nr:ATP-binding cassette domain-containing protein [Deltaproteobacteria bacterium]